jgi:hypothetical protein
MKYLFIGGPADGEWRETEDGDVVHVRSLPPIVPRKIDNDDIEFFPSMPKGHVSTEYRKRVWGAGDHISILYTPIGDSDFDTFNRLLKGYKPCRDVS